MNTIADHLLAMVDQRRMHSLPRRFVHVVVVECSLLPNSDRHCVVHAIRVPGIGIVANELAPNIGKRLCQNGEGGLRYGQRPALGDGLSGNLMHINRLLSRFVFPGSNRTRHISLLAHRFPPVSITWADVAPAINDGVGR
jgi:hypothetical protein